MSWRSAAIAYLWCVSLIILTGVAILVCAVVERVLGAP